MIISVILENMYSFEKRKVLAFAIQLRPNEEIAFNFYI